jgi:hypothetical protein
VSSTKPGDFVIISNKLDWARMSLKATEPTLNTGKHDNVKQNVQLVQNKVPRKFLTLMKDVGLIARNPSAG